MGDLPLEFLFKTGQFCDFLSSIQGGNTQVLVYDLGLWFSEHSDDTKARFFEPEDSDCWGNLPEVSALTHWEWKRDVIGGTKPGQLLQSFVILCYTLKSQGCVGKQVSEILH